MSHLKALPSVLEKRIRKLIGEFNGAFNDNVWETEHDEGDGDRIENAYRLERKELLERKMEDLAKNIYNHFLAYTELLNLLVYRNQFVEEVGPIINDREKILGGEYLHEFGDVFSNFTEIIWRYFSPICSPDDENDLVNRNSNLIILENILEHTAVSLQQFDIIPKRETEISVLMNKICRAVFPEATFPTEAFVRIAKTYIPDILIPNLKCAVEYKVGNTEKNIDKTIEDILIDVDGYSKNRSYKLFYAVFYVKPGIISRKRFYELWKDKSFPDNWKPILVEGLMSEKKT